VLNVIVDIGLKDVRHDCMRLVQQTNVQLIGYLFRVNPREVKLPGDTARWPSSLTLLATAAR
jgi:hypothetical protein